MERATPQMAERMLDFLYGVTYALDGTVEKIGEKVFLFFLLILIGPAVGRVIADIAHRVSGRRRGRYTWLVVCGAIVAGAAPFLLRSLLPLLLFGARGGTSALFGGGFLLLYLGLTVATAYSSLRFGK